MGACGSKSASKKFEGEGHSLGQTSNKTATTAAGAGSPTVPSATHSPGYRLGGSGGDPEKVNGADGAGVGALSPTSASNAEEREKRLAAVEKRRAADKYKDVQVKPRAFSQIEAR